MATAKKAKKKTPAKKTLVKMAHDPYRVLKNGVARTLVMKILSVTPKRVVAEMPIDERHMNRNGRVNGGALMAFADALGACGAVANRPPGYSGGTIESKTNFFSAGLGPVLHAVSIPLHIGRTTSVWQTTIRNPDGSRVAIVTQTQIAIPKIRSFDISGKKKAPAKAVAKKPAAKGAAKK